MILKRISEAVQTQKWPESLTSLFFNVNGVARDTNNNKLHNEKTPQPTKRSKKR